MDESYAGASNELGEAETRLTYSGNPVRYILKLLWRTPYAKAEGELQVALVRSGTKEQITDFIAEWLLKFPDPDLMTEALEKCNGKLPEGDRLF
jgi:hypothetical protein